MPCLWNPGSASCQLCQSIGATCWAVVSTKDTERKNCSVKKQRIQESGFARLEHRIQNLESVVDQLKRFLSQKSVDWALNEYSRPVFGVMSWLAPSALESVQLRLCERLPQLNTMGWNNAVIEDILAELASYHVVHNFHRQLPTLHPLSFVRSVSSSAKSNLLLESVAAVALRVTSTPYTETDMFSQAMMHQVEQKLYSQVEPSVETVQVAMQAAQFEIFGGNIRNAYVHAGIAARMSMELNLHLLDSPMDPPSISQNLLWWEKETLRRLFWSCYISDRVSSTFSDRPFFVSDETICVRLPGDDVAWLEESDTPTFSSHLLNFDLFLDNSEESVLPATFLSTLILSATMIGRISKFLAINQSRETSHFMVEFDRLSNGLERLLTAQHRLFSMNHTSHERKNDDEAGMGTMLLQAQTIRLHIFGLNACTDDVSRHHAMAKIASFAYEILTMARATRPSLRKFRNRMPFMVFGLNAARLGFVRLLQCYNKDLSLASYLKLTNNKIGMGADDFEASEKECQELLAEWNMVSGKPMATGRSI